MAPGINKQACLLLADVQQAVSVAPRLNKQACLLLADEQQAVSVAPRETQKSTSLGGLVGAVAEEELDDVPFVRLEPIEAGCRYSANVEAIDVRRL